MKINVFNTQCHIGSTVRLDGKDYTVYDIDRKKHIMLIWHGNHWVRCTEVELIKERKK